MIEWHVLDTALFDLGNWPRHAAVDHRLRAWPGAASLAYAFHRRLLTLIEADPTAPPTADRIASRRTTAACAWPADGAVPARTAGDLLLYVTGRC
jgi:hypothetical protein